MPSSSSLNFTYDFDAKPNPSTVRLLISDIDSVNPIFSDLEIDTFLALEGDDVRLAAAQALDTIARNEALVLKVIRTQDLQTDGAKLSAELREHAKALRAQVADGAGTDADDELAVVGGIGRTCWPEGVPRPWGC